MPYNPKTYRLHLNTHLRQALDAAVEREGGVFIPCGTKEDAMVLRMSLGQYRKAHEAQYLEQQLAANETYAYAYLKMDCILREGLWGIFVHALSKKPLPLQDPVTGKALIDPQTGKPLA